MNRTNLKGKQTMKPISAAVLTALASLIVVSSPAAAQRSITLGVSGGLSLPTGTMSDAFSSGYHVGGHLNFAPESSPVELMVDATYHSFGGNLDLPEPVDFSYFGISGSAAYMLPGENSQPYLMGGVGMYFGKADVEGAESDSEFGFNVGGGIRFLLSGLSTFFQVRANFVGDNTFIPVSFGVMF